MRVCLLVLFSCCLGLGSAGAGDQTCDWGNGPCGGIAPPTLPNTGSACVTWYLGIKELGYTTGKRPVQQYAVVPLDAMKDSCGAYMGAVAGTNGYVWQTIVATVPNGSGGYTQIPVPCGGRALLTNCTSQ